MNYLVIKKNIVVMVVTQATQTPEEHNQCVRPLSMPVLPYPPMENNGKGLVYLLVLLQLFRFTSKYTHLIPAFSGFLNVKI